MSKYKVGDKVVLTVTSKVEDPRYSYYILSDDAVLLEKTMNEDAEPLTTYTEPLERKNENKQKQIEKLVDKLHRQATEITRLLAENKELKEEYNQAFNQGTEAAWELARKIVIQNGYSSHDLYEIFESNDLQLVLEEYTYPEAAAKVAEWEKAKEEIKVGDVVSHEEKYGVVISEGTICFRGFTDDGTPFEWYKERCTKTGRHIDIDSFLKQIGGENDEK